MLPTNIAAATVIIAYTAMPALPASVSLEQRPPRPHSQWRPADPVSLPAFQIADEQLREICSLDPNWDGYGGLPIHGETARIAKVALQVFQHFSIVPEITPNPNGTISLEWSSPRGRAHLEVGKSRYVGIVRPNANADIPLSGNASELAARDINYVSATIAAALFPPQSVPVSSRFYVTSNARSAA